MTNDELGKVAYRLMNRFCADEIKDDLAEEFAKALRQVAQTCAGIADRVQKREPYHDVAQAIRNHYRLKANEVKICKDCGFVIKENRDENSCWCGVMLKVTKKGHQNAHNKSI